MIETTEGAMVLGEDFWYCVKLDDALSIVATVARIRANGPNSGHFAFLLQQTGRKSVFGPNSCKM